jgi:hypothetical protein
VTIVRLLSRRARRRPDVWVTEIRVRESRITPALRRLIALVRRYEDLS